MGRIKTTLLALILLATIVILAGCQDDLGEVAYNGEQIGQEQWREFMSDQPAHLPPLRSDRMLIQDMQDELN
ncbi:MAG: hypothetical protein JW912_03690 [Sedimentisphaerales bacterium]|nr:hypothetical protein [Sedimentisphaerales bacterium]